MCDIGARVGESGRGVCRSGKARVVSIGTWVEGDGEMGGERSG